MMVLGWYTFKPSMLHCLPHVTLRCMSTRQADKVPLFKKKVNSVNRAYLSGAVHLSVFVCTIACLFWYFGFFLKNCKDNERNV